MYEENRAVPFNLFFHGFLYNFGVELLNVHFHRLASLGRGVYYAYVSYVGEGKLQGSRDGSRGKREHVNGVFHRSYGFFVVHAEFLLLVYDRKPQVFQFYPFSEKLMRSDYQVEGTVFKPL